MAKYALDKAGVTYLWGKIKSALSGKADASHSHDTATTSKAGFMSTSQVSKLSNVNAAVILKENLSVATSAWASDSTYSDYPYRAAVAISGCATSHFPEVAFSLTDAISGTFSPVAATYTGGVYIYASEKPTSTITIPAIKLTKVVS